MVRKSPEYVRTSTAAAITLKLSKGRFYRNARLGCINLLLEYPEGCYANCSYCGLACQRQGSYTEKSFIRVAWPLIPLAVAIEQMQKITPRLGRICLSMITHKDAVNDTVSIVRSLRESVDLPVSILICPTVVNRDALLQFASAGADKIGIAIDAATPELFEKHRGHQVGGPHKWDQYWTCFSDAVDVFGRYNVGSHLMVGLGETEKEMTEAIQKTRHLGGFTHLFSFFPETGSQLEHIKPPPLDMYRRIQLARYLIDQDLMSDRVFTFDHHDRIQSFGIESTVLTHHINTGLPFETSGCQGADGTVACNRPFANSVPGPDVRNLPYKANQEDIARITETLGLCIEI